MKTHPVLEFFAAHRTQSYSVHDVVKQLRVRQKFEYEVKNEIYRLVKAGSIIRLKTGRFKYAQSKKESLVGKLQMTDRGFGFVILFERGMEDIFVPGMKLGGALHGDTVRVEEEFYHGKREGRIVQIVERSVTDIAGIFAKGQLLPFEDVFPAMPCQARKEFKAAEGKVVRARLTSYSPLRATIVAILGEFDDPAIDDDIVISKYRLPYEYPELEQDFYDELHTRTVAELPLRKDLTHLMTFTIDPADARDHDDAVSVEKIPTGWRVYVHIADVSFYVEEGGVLDGLAYERGFSTYLTSTFLPMLPYTLTKDVCSLREGSDKLTMTAVMEYDAEGKKTASEVFPAKVRITKFLSYDDAAAIIDGALDAPQEWRNALCELTECAKKINALRTKAGALDLDMPEFGVVLNEKKEPVSVYQRERTWAHRLIEEFMIAANETVAAILEKKDIGGVGIYRVHDKPSDEKMAAYQELLEEFGIVVTKMSAQKFQEVFESLHDDPAGAFLKKELVKSLKRAEYSEKNSGHFGLHSESYTHFTSPIRRYPDLIAHRLLKGMNIDKKYLQKAAGYLSEKENDAERAEMLSYKIKALRYIKKLPQKEFTAIVVADDIDKFRVELTEYGVRGVVYFKDCITDYRTIVLGKIVTCRPLVIEPVYGVLECEIMEVRK